MRVSSITISRGAVIAMGATATLAGLALLPGAWGRAYGQTAGTPLPPAQPVTTTVSSSTGGTLAVPAPSGSTTPALTIAIPPGATASAVTITATAPQVISNPQQLPPNIPPPPPPAAGTSRITAVFTLDATVAGGQRVDAAHPFEQPVTLTLPVPAETLAAAAGSGDTIVLAFFNEASGTWQEVPTTVVDGVLSAQVTHFSRWALIVHKPQPAQAVPQPPKTGTGSGVDTRTDRATAAAARAPRGLIALAMLIAATVGAGGAALTVARRRPQ